MYPETSCMRRTPVHTKNISINSFNFIRFGTLLWLFGSGNISGTSRNGLQVRLSLNSVLVCITDLTGEEEVKRKRQGEGTCRNLIKYGNFTSWLPEWV